MLFKRTQKGVERARRSIRKTRGKQARPCTKSKNAKRKMTYSARDRKTEYSPYLKKQQAPCTRNEKYARYKGKKTNRRLADTGTKTKTIRSRAEKARGNTSPKKKIRVQVERESGERGKNTTR